MRKWGRTFQGHWSYHRFDHDCVHAQNLEKYPLTWGIPYKIVKKVGIILGILATMTLPGENRDDIQNQWPVVAETQKNTQGDVNDILLMTIPLGTSDTSEQ